MKGWGARGVGGVNEGNGGGEGERAGHSAREVCPRDRSRGVGRPAVSIAKYVRSLRVGRP